MILFYCRQTYFCRLIQGFSMAHETGPTPILQDQLAALRQLVAQSTAHLAAACIEQGVISMQRLNQRQTTLFDLALVAAQLTAAEQLVQHAATLAPDATPDAVWVHTLAELQVADTVQAGLSCFTYREAEFGLEEAAVATLARHSAQFLRAQHAPARIAAAAELLYTVGHAGADNLSAEQRAVQTTFRRFAETRIAPIAQQLHCENRLLPDEYIAELAAMGCFGLSIPTEHGGYQEGEASDHLAMVLASEQLARVSFATVGSLLIRPELVAGVLLTGATPAQQARWLPRIARGELQMAVAVSEPDRGSDLTQMQTMARRTPGGWLLSGRKMWCTLAGRADMVMVLACTDPTAADPRRGLSLFMVEKPATYGRTFEHVQEQGTFAGQAVATLGYRGLHSFQLSFDNYFVPADNLIGGAAGEGMGYFWQIHSFAGGRVQTAARGLGVMAAAFEAALGYAPQRVVFGHPLADYPLTQRKLVRMAMLIQAGRRLTYYAAQERDEVQALIAGAMAKLFTARAAEWITREAQQLHGGVGYAEETPVARHFVDARLLGIFEGADEVVAVLVIAWLLLSREIGAYGR
jgi:(2S)-methylsuccinyl-CoA dehydrogenase